MWWMFAALALAGGKPDSPEKLIAMRQRREGKLAVGDRAPDAPLYTPDGKSTTLLAQKKEGRPLVLVFGSFT